MELSDKSSLPDDFEDVLELYTLEGYRVIALAQKQLQIKNKLDVHSISREQAESGLQFLGFLVMENKLKEATVGVISNLRDCKVRVVMATGDNVLTAVSVARQCHIIDGEKECFLADVNDKNEVFWKSTNHSLNFLPGVLPWDYHDETIEVACSGRAFKHFIANQT